MTLEGSRLGARGLPRGVRHGPGHLEHTCALQDRDWQGAALLAWVGILAWPAVPGPLLSFLSLPFPRFLWAPILLPTAWFST